MGGAAESSIPYFEILEPQAFVDTLYPENAYFLEDVVCFYSERAYVYGIFSSIPSLPAWSFQGVTNG
jgi:hypothetical protein